MRLEKLKNRKMVFFSIFIIIIFNFLILFFFSTPVLVSAQDTSPPEASLSTIPDSEYKTADPGDSVNYMLLLQNQGSQRETFFVSVESEYSWDVDVTPQTGMNLNPDETEEITITFQIPTSLRETDYQFNVIVKSRNLPAAKTTIHIVPFGDEVIITAAIKPILITKPSRDDLGRISPGESVEVKVRVSCYVTSAEIYLDYDLFKVRRSVLSLERNLTVTIDPESKYISKGESFTFTVKIEFPKDFDKKIDYKCQLTLEAKAYGYDEISRPVILKFIIKHEPKQNFFETLIASPLILVGLTTLVVVGALGAVIGGSEVGKYRFLLLFFIPLYTKLHKDKILDHFTRGRVYEFIRNNPGVHYSQIKRELDLNNGNLTYHLHTLEREALIKSKSAGRFKVFYITGVKIPKDMEPQISSVRKQIIDIIQEQPGITQKELSIKFNDKSSRTIGYHVKNMAREGILKLEKDGRENRCYINDDVVDLQEGQVGRGDGLQKDDDAYSENLSDSVFRQI
jgi:predicted transcriptional regulator